METASIIMTAALIIIVIFVVKLYYSVTCNNKKDAVILDKLKGVKYTHNVLEYPFERIIATCKDGTVWVKELDHTKKQPEWGKWKKLN